MKTTLPLALVLALSSPALAIDWPVFLGHYDPEYAGFVGQWPEVVRTRELEKLCLPQQIATIERDKRALEARTLAIYGPAFGRAMSATPAPSATEPNPRTPAVPTLSTSPAGASKPTTETAKPAADTPAAPAPR